MKPYALPHRELGLFLGRHDLPNRPLRQGRARRSAGRTRAQESQHQSPIEHRRKWNFAPEHPPHLLTPSEGPVWRFSKVDPGVFGISHLEECIHIAPHSKNEYRYFNT